MYIFNIKNTKKNHSEAGFSLVELMVTVGIIVLVTGIIMTKYSSFNGVVLLKSQAYELALDIREAQVLGVNAGGNDTDSRGAFGIYLDKNTSTYLLFQDVSGATEFKYDESATESVGEAYTIDKRFQITDICAGINCFNEASVSFKRPDFDAKIYAEGFLRNELRISLGSLDGSLLRYTVVVYPSGQITVE